MIEGLETGSGRWWRVLAAAALLMGFGLRFHLLDAQSFWNDEGNSARLSERSLELIIEGTASDIHPPLYYLLLHGWRAVAGDSEFALRAFSAFAGALIIPVVMALGLLLGGERPYPAALIAGLVTAVSPPLIYYSQETRMYALLGLLAVLSTLFLAKFLVVSFQFSVFSGQAVGWGVAYVLCAAAGLYTHYFFPAILLAQNLVFLGVLLRFRMGGEMARGNVVAPVYNHTAPSRPCTPVPHPLTPSPCHLVTPSPCHIFPRPPTRHSPPLPPLAAHLSAAVRRGRFGRAGAVAAFFAGCVLVAGLWANIAICLVGINGRSPGGAVWSG
ncbi:MAG TPA: hypothetical protein ENK32_08665 [Anaerolineae bacterium]|nr:hypothetical protein [Anaerolineae bacterium]